jgi:hypothetical protein
LIDRGSLDATRIELTGHQAISFGSSERIGEHLVRDSIESLVEVLVSAPAFVQFSQDRKRPSTAEHLDDRSRLLPVISHVSGSPLGWRPGRSAALRLRQSSGSDNKDDGFRAGDSLASPLGIDHEPPERQTTPSAGGHVEPPMARVSS